MTSPMITEEMKADGWVEHDGGPCPAALDRRVSVRWNNGAISSGCVARTWSSEGARDGADFWTGTPSAYIIAYREEPRP